MTIECFYETNVSSQNFLNPRWNFSVIRKSRTWVISLYEIANEEWIDYYENLGIHFKKWATIFYKPEFEDELRAHVDIVNLNEKINCISSGALNFIIGGANSKMLWYKPTNQEIKLIYTPENSPYAEFDLNTLELLDSYKIQEKNFTLVRTDVPHKIKNGPFPRICISLRLENIELYTWNSMVELFRTKNLLK